MHSNAPHSTAICAYDRRGAMADRALLAYAIVVVSGPFQRVHRVMEHYNVATMNRLNMVGDSVDHNPLVILKERQHAGPFNLHGLVQKKEDGERRQGGKDKVPEPIASFKKAPPSARTCHGHSRKANVWNGSFLHRRVS